MSEKTITFFIGCTVKFEQDDKEFRTSEEIAAFCTTPGGRRRDDMNFYTSGMKIVGISEEKPNLAVGRVSSAYLIFLIF